MTIYPGTATAEESQATMSCLPSYIVTQRTSTIATHARVSLILCSPYVSAVLLGCQEIRYYAIDGLWWVAFCAFDLLQPSFN